MKKKPKIDWIKLFAKYDNWSMRNDEFTLTGIYLLSRAKGKIRELVEKELEK